MITSPSNQHIAQLHSLHTPKGRAQEDSFLIEGPHLLDAALDAHLVPRLIVYDPEQLGRGARGRQLLGRIEAARAAGATALEAAPAALERASEARTPQGVVAAVATADVAPEKVRARRRGRFRPLLFVVDGVSDPGNLGTILRSAEAFGAAGIFLTEGTVSPYNSKVLRGSAGSIFRLPFLQISSAELVPLLRAHGVRLLATSSHQGTPLPQISWTLPLAIFIGNEGAGLSRELTRQMDETLAIPQTSQVESLNAGVAASIVLYEAAKSQKSEVKMQK